MIKLKDLIKEWYVQDPGPKRWTNNKGLTEFEQQGGMDLFENTVRLSTYKDANFGPGFVQLMGKKGYVKLDKKSVHKLAKIVRSHSKGSGMGWSFTAFEGNISEGKSFTLPNGIRVNIDFKGLTFVGGSKPVFLDRKEMEVFFKATARYLK